MFSCVAITKTVIFPEVDIAVPTCRSSWFVISTAGRNLFSDFADLSVTPFLRDDIVFLQSDRARRV